MVKGKVAKDAKKNKTFITENTEDHREAGCMRRT